MKKIIAFLSTLILTISTVVSVVACAPKPETDVVFLMPGNVLSSTSKQWKAYNYIANQFNDLEEMQNSSTKVKVVWEVSNAIESRIASNEPLPDLYLSYADNVSSYSFDPNLQDQVRNMEASITGNEELNQDFKDQFWSPSLYNEGVINDKLAVLPMNKSYDISILNVKVFLELVRFINTDWALEIGDSLSHEERKFTDESTNLFGLKPVNFIQNQKLNIPENLIKELEKIEKAEQKSTAMRIFFQKDQNVLDLASIYNQLFEINKNDDSFKNYLKENYLGANGDPDLVYSLGLETPENKIFMEYADMMQQSNIDPTNLEQSGDFFYNVNVINPYEGKAEIILDNKDSDNFKKASAYFDQLRQIAPKTGDSSAKRWSGSMITGKMLDAQKIVAGHYFVQGTMLLTSGTSAGSYDYNPSAEDDKTIKVPQFDRDTDLMVVPSPTASGNYANFFQQGSGIAGFKSTGKNASDKENVVNKFLKYLLEPKIQNRLAIMAGYLPSTRLALERYRFYNNDAFDNEHGIWTINEEKRPENWEDYEQIPSLDVVGPTYKNERDLIMTDFLDNFVLADPIDPLLPKLNIVTTKANPFGSLVRSQISNALKNYIFVNPQQRKFEDLLTGSGEDWDISRTIWANRPQRFNNLRVTFRKN